MKDHIKIKTSLTLWDRIIVFQDNTTVKGILFVYIFLLIFFGRAFFLGDINYLWFKFSDSDETQGYVNNVLSTSYRTAEGDRISHYFYTYVLDGETHFGDCYSTWDYRTGETAAVEYLPNFENKSRLYKSSNAPYDGKITLWGLPLVFLLIYILRSQYIKLNSIQKLLKNAYLIKARLISSEPYVEHGYDEDDGAYSYTAMYTLIYEYEFNGETKQTHVETEERELFPQNADLLISVKDPSLVILRNCLPEATALRIRKMKKKLSLP